MLYFLFVCAVISCNNKKDDPAIHYPSEQYEYISIDTSKIAFKTSIYVPIYSHVYILDGTRPLNLAATLSIRSTDFSDSIFISKVDYYNSKGELIKKYLNKILLLKPMHSAAFVVVESNTEGGAGAYFIINWSAKKSISGPLIQAVMLGTALNSGFSFKTDGIKLTNGK
ncbi:MAG TPA: DUF3124 domain-containing protein [Ginsengibacter sp.]|nr:DUF3124 domain-containing protein [Ginsengibacter sp.]